MRKTTFITDFEKEVINGTNKEHFNAIMVEWEKEWDLNLRNLNAGHWTNWNHVVPRDEKFEFYFKAPQATNEIIISEIKRTYNQTFLYIHMD